MAQIYESVLYGVFMALAIFFWIWLFRRLYLNGWRPLIVVLIAMYWQRLMFAFAWIRFSRRQDNIDAFLEDPERTKRAPVAGMVEDK